MHLIMGKFEWDSPSAIHGCDASLSINAAPLRKSPDCRHSGNEVTLPECQGFGDLCFSVRGPRPAGLTWIEVRDIADNEPVSASGFPNPDLSSQHVWTSVPARNIRGRDRAPPWRDTPDRSRPQSCSRHRHISRFRLPSLNPRLREISPDPLHRSSGPAGGKSTC